MGNIISIMLAPIIRTFKKENRPMKRIENDKFCTPPRAQSRASNRDFRDINVQDPRNNRLAASFPVPRNASQYSLTDARENKGTPIRPPSSQSRDFKANVRGRNRINSSPSRLPDSFPLTRNRSQISLFGSREIKGTPIRPPSSLRIRESTQNLSNDAFDLSFSNARQDNLGISKRRNSSSVLSYHTGDQLSIPNLDFAEPLNTRKSRLGNNPHAVPGNLIDHSLDYPFLESERREDSSQVFRHVPIPTHKDSESSFLFHTAPKNQSSNESAECYDALHRRHLLMRSNPPTTSGFSHPYKYGCSKIPKKIYNSVRVNNSPKAGDFMNFSDRHRGRYTLSTKKNSHGVLGFQGKGDAVDSTCIKTNDISNWITFRNDTSMKFETVYRSLSKKRHRPTSNIIDSTTHAQWMRLAGITVDKDSIMFKNFAGGKVVLTFGEYKFLIHKICTSHDLDYWDVLRKMATFQDDEMQHEDGLAFC